VTALLSKDDIVGAWVILPTPATRDASDWRATNTVNLDETVRIVDALIVAGANGLLSLGTFGEGATLTWEEKRQFMGAVVETVRGRVPYFCGTTALHTREVVRQTREAADIGATGTMLGPPMWCAADLPTAIEFYRNIAEACPDTAICVYANPEAFKFTFPRPFWAAVASIRQVVCCKYLNIAQLNTDLKLAPSIRFLPVEADYLPAARMAPDDIKAFWSSGALCGPLPTMRLRDEVIRAKQSNDWSQAKMIADNIAAADVGLFPKGEFAEFSKYNIGLEKERMNAAGWLNAGPPRPPYHLVPAEYLEGARRSGRAWKELNLELSGNTDRVDNLILQNLRGGYLVDERPAS
jgi:trans-o-hydroxybenzylidenepyruvate hydratase-aldolase